MIVIRQDSLCDARIACDDPPAYASYLPEGVFSSIKSIYFSFLELATVVHNWLALAEK